MFFARCWLKNVFSDALSGYIQLSYMLYITIYNTPIYTLKDNELKDMSTGILQNMFFFLKFRVFCISE